MKYDRFFACCDLEPLGVSTNWLAVSSADALCLAEGFTVSLVADPGYVIGQIASITGGGKTAYCRVIRQVTGGSRSVTLRPIQSTIDSAGVIGHTFPSTSVIIGTVRQDAFSLVLDLSDAPDGTYNYVILSSGSVVAGSVNDVSLQLLSKALVDDPLGGDGSSLSEAARWKANSTDSLEPFNFVDLVSLEAGQRYEFRLCPSTVSASQVSLVHPRIVAVRYDAINQASQISQVTTTSTTAVDIISLSSLPAGDYFVIAGWLTQGSLNGTSDQVTTRLRDDTAGNNLGGLQYSGVATTDYFSAGYAAVHSFGVTTTLKLQHFVLSGSGTARTKNARLIALPLPPGFSEMIGRHPATGTNSSLVSEAWNDLLDSDEGTTALDLEAGTHLEVVQFGNLMAQKLRPKWGGDVFEPTRRGLAYAEQPGSVGERSYCNFFLHRAKRIAGAGKNTLQTYPGSGVTSQAWRQVHFSFLRETPKLEPTSETPYCFAAELEVGYALKKWSPTGTDVWSKELPNVGLVTRVVVNGKDYTRVSASPTVAETFFWDVSAREVTIKMLSGDSPADNDRIVLIGVPILAGRDPEVFTDDDGVERPYDARLIDAPSVTETLDIKADGAQVVSKYGSLSLVMEADPDRKVPHFDGMRLLVKRGRRGIHTKLKQMPALLAGRMQRERRFPQRGEFSVELLDRSLVLQNPIAQTVVPVYSGTTQRENYLLPVVYGTLRRVVARRTTNNGSGTNTFKVAGHAVKNIGALQSDGTFQAKAYIDGTELTPSVASITVTLTSASFAVPDSDTANWQRDVLYVDVQGMCTDGPTASSGALLERPGEIARHILLTYGGLLSTQLVESSFRLMDRRWRVRRKTAGPVPLGVKIGLYLTEQKVRDALNEIRRTAFCFWLESRAGRVRLRVPDPAAANIIGNSGFEDDASNIFPWRHGELATSTLSTTLKYQGARALQLSNGQTVIAPKPYGDLRQTVLCHKPGLYALTAVVSLQNGDGTACRLAFVSPHDGLMRQLSTAIQVMSEQWMRVSTVVEIEEGSAGTGTVLLLPYAPEGLEPSQPAYGANIRGDWDASAVSGFSDGDTIAQWDDKSGHANHAAQGSASLRPKYVANAIAGHAGVLFDDDDGLVTPLNLSIPCTVIAVYAYRSSLATNRRAVTGSNDWFIGPWQNLNQGFVDSGFVPASSPPSVDPFQPVVVTLRQTSSSSSELFVNGVSVGTQTAAAQVGPGTLRFGTSITGTEEIVLLRVLAFSMNINPTRRSTWEQYLMRKYGIVPTSVNVDNVEAFPVAAYLEPIGDEGPGLNAKVIEVSVRRDHFFAARVPYNPNLQDRSSDVGVIRTDSEARGLISSYDPDASEARGTLPASGRIDQRDVIISAPTEAEGIESSRGVSNDLALWFGRQREVASVDTQGLTELPELGERVFHGKLSGIPRTPDDYPIGLVTAIDDDNDPASNVRLELEREKDPISDRHEIAPTEIPLGSVVLVTASSCPTDYEEVTEQRTFYAAGANVPNLTSIFGFSHHIHDLTHDHPLPPHGHTASVSALGASVQAEHEIPADDEEKLARQALFTTQPAARGKSSGDHGHAVTGSLTYANGSATSSPPLSTLQTYKGPNAVKHRRVLFCRRVGKTQSTIDPSIILGFINPAAPNGWQLCDGTNGGAGTKSDLRGYAIRGADPGNTGVSSRAISSNHTQSDAANGALGNYVVCDLTGINLYDRVTMTDGTKTVHGVVSSIDQPNGRFTLQPSHETGDSVDGSVYSSSNSTFSTDSADVNATRDPSAHLHVRSGADGTGAIPAHLHTAVHKHVGLTGTLPTVGVPSDTIDVSVQEADSLPDVRYSNEVHPHGLSHLELPEETAQTAAQSSSPFGGSLATASVNKPPVLRLPFISPTSGSETQVPAGSVILVDQTNCPLGYSPVSQANGRLIMGALTGEGMVAEDGGHLHDATFAAHSLNHRHVPGGSYTDVSDAVILEDSDYQTSFVGLDTDYIATGTEDFGGGARLYGHAHQAPVTNVSLVDPTLTQVVTVTGLASGASTMPPHKRWKLCVKA